MAKKLTPEQRLKQESLELAESIKRWKDISEKGCSDPSWPDGINMNLVRNHIFYHKRKIYELCEENSFTFPDCMYIPIPPKVSNYYMQNLNQKERVKRLVCMGNVLVTERPAYDDAQMSFTFFG